MSFIKDIWADKYLRFIVCFIVLYFVFYYFNIFFIGLTTKGGLYNAFIAENLNYIKWWREWSLAVTAKILRALDYTVLTNEFRLKVVGAKGIILVYSCLGYGIMSVFAAFCLTFPRPLKQRLLFMLCGLIFIQSLNISRFVFLSLYANKNNLPLGLNHHDVYNVLIYFLLIMICYIWIRNTANKNVRNPA